MYQVGIDIGSSAAKTAVIKDGEVVKTYLLNTGFSSRKTAGDIYQMLEKDGSTRITPPMWLRATDGYRSPMPINL